MKYFLVVPALLLLAGCGDSTTADDMSGVWVGEELSREPREIALRSDGSFNVKRFPAELACSDSEVKGDVDGHGTWEYEPDTDRVFLKFSLIKNERCSAPYGVMVFRQPGGKLSAFLDVDKPSSAIVFVRSQSP